MTIRRFEDMIAWQKARKLTAEIYAATRRGQFAKDFSLVDQIRRAAVSIVSNLAEGFDRGNNKEFLTFLGFAKGSSAEVRSQLYVALDIGYIDSQEFARLNILADEVSKLLNGLITSLRKSPISGPRFHFPTP